MSEGENVGNFLIADSLPVFFFHEQPHGMDCINMKIPTFHHVTRG